MMKRFEFILMLIVILAGCAPGPTEIATPVIISPTAMPTPTELFFTFTPSPLPPDLTATVTPDPVHAHHRSEIQNIIESYFELRYQALSISPPEDFQRNGFGNLISKEPDARDFLVTEMAKLSVERKWAELNGFRYAKYEYSLEYKNIALDASAKVATVALLEDFVIVTERAMEQNPDMPSITRGDQIHQIILQYEQGQWKIVSDTYWDAWWRRYRKPGMSTNEILNEINMLLQELEAMPTTTSPILPTP